MSHALSVLTIRPFEPSDRGYILDSFRRHLGWDRLAGVAPGDVQIHVAELDKLLRGAGRTLIATLPSQPEKIFGWACAADGALRFCYVGKAFRRWGIGSQLVTALISTVPVPLVYWTTHAEKIRKRRQFPLVWNWQQFSTIRKAAA